jgi:hypothetical protein
MLLTWEAVVGKNWGNQELQKADLFSVYSHRKMVVQPRISIRPLEFECPDCGSKWHEEIIFTPEGVVFKRPPCPKCGDERTLGPSIAA